MNDGDMISLGDDYDDDDASFVSDSDSEVSRYTNLKEKNYYSVNRHMLMLALNPFGKYTKCSLTSLVNYV